MSLSPWLLRVWTDEGERQLVCNRGAGGLEGVGDVPVKEAPGGVVLLDDDSIGTITKKLSGMFGCAVHWWTEQSARRLQKVPGKARLGAGSLVAKCPYLEDVFATREGLPFVRGGLMAEEVTPSALTLLLEDVADTRVIHMCGAARAIKQCAHLAQAVMSVTKCCESLSAADIEEADAIMTNPVAGEYVSSVTCVTARISGSGGAGAAGLRLNLVFSKLELTTGGAMLVGIKLRDGQAGVRVLTSAVQSGVLRVKHVVALSQELSGVSVEEDTLVIVFAHAGGVHEARIRADLEGTVTSREPTESLDSACDACLEAAGGVGALVKRQVFADPERVTVSVKVTLNHALSKATDSSLYSATARLDPVFTRSTVPGQPGVLLTWRRVSGTSHATQIEQYVRKHAGAAAAADLEDVLVPAIMRRFGVARDEAIVAVYQASHVDGVAGGGIAAHVRTSPTGLSVRLHGTGPVRYASRALAAVLGVMTPRGAASTSVGALEQAADILRQGAAVQGSPGRAFGLTRLVAADAKLFGETRAGYASYAKQCGAVDGRQPVVVTAERMAEIRATGSSIDALRAGEGGNFYMCPELWCPGSQTPLVRGEGCPGGEEPEDLSGAKWWKGAKGRFPGFLDPVRHPLGLCAPCCYKLRGERMLRRIAECSGEAADDGGATYVLAASALPLPPGRRGHLPAPLTGETFEDVFRMGVPQSGDPVTEAVAGALKMTREQIVSQVEGRLTLLDLARLANGNLLRRFVNRGLQLTDSAVKERFEAFLKSKPHILRGLPQARKERARTFVMWNARESMLEYVARGGARSHTLLLPILTAALGVGIAVVEADPEIGALRLHCSYGGSTRRPVRVVILKQGGVYEPLVHDGKVPPFLATLSRTARTLCNTRPVALSHAQVRSHLEDTEGLKVEGQVLDMSFVVRGLLASGLYVPLPVAGVFDPELPVVFEDAVPASAGPRWRQPGEVTSLLGRLPHKWYVDSSEVELASGGRAVQISGELRVPIERASEIMQDALGDANVFVSGATSLQAGDSTSDRVALAHAHESMMHHLSTSHQRELYVLSHPSSPFPAEARVAMFMELTSDLSDMRVELQRKVAARMAAGVKQPLEEVVGVPGELVASEESMMDGAFVHALRLAADGDEHVTEIRRRARVELRSVGGGSESDLRVASPAGWESSEFRVPSGGRSLEVLRGAARLSVDRMRGVLTDWVLRQWDRGALDAAMAEELAAAGSVRTVAASLTTLMPVTLELAAYVLSGSAVDHVAVREDGSVASRSRCGRSRCIIVTEAGSGVAFAAPDTVSGEQGT
jgi:hypothetical protein